MANHGLRYQPDAIFTLRAEPETRIQMHDLRRASISEVIAALPADDRYTDAERRAVSAYLEERLSRFQNETETLDEVERRDFGYVGA
jgi:hypothetical protein